MAEKGDWSEGGVLLAWLLCGIAAYVVLCRCFPGPSCGAIGGESGGAQSIADDQVPDELLALWRLISGSLIEA